MHRKINLVSFCRWNKKFVYYVYLRSFISNVWGLTQFYNLFLSSRNHYSTFFRYSLKIPCRLIVVKKTDVLLILTNVSLFVHSLKNKFILFSSISSGHITLFSSSVTTKLISKWEMQVPVYCNQPESLIHFRIINSLTHLLLNMTSKNCIKINRTKTCITMLNWHGYTLLWIYLNY